MIKRLIKNKVKSKIKRGIKNIVLILLRHFGVPIIIILILTLLVCYITDIFYLGINNEEESNMKEEIKYYTTAEYTKDLPSEALKEIS